MFNAAGLIVPDPSIMLPPIPFIDVDTGSGAEYMTARLGVTLTGRHSLVAPTQPVRQSAGVEGWRRGCQDSEFDDC